MAYTTATLRTITSAPGHPALHTYTSTDNIADVDDSGYFNGATDRLAQGDVVINVDTDTGTIRFLRISSTTGAATVTTTVLAVS